MADLNFPQNPQVGDTYSIGNRTWVWNGSGWQLQSGIISTTPFTVVSAYVTTTTNSTSTNSGALIVEGGGGFGGNIYAADIFSNGAQVITTGTIGNFGVSSLQAGTDTAVALLFGNVGLIWNTSTLQTVTGRGATTTNAISITNQTESTSTTSGALTVTGGVGIGETLTIGKSANIGFNETNYISVSGGTTGSAVTLASAGGDAVVKLSLIAKGNGVTEVTNSLASSTTASNALYVVGGLGVEGAAYINNVFDNSRRVLTRVYPTAGTAISITSVSTSNDTTTFTVNNEGVTSLNGSEYIAVNQVVGDVVITNQGVRTLTAGTDTAVSTSTGTVTVWSTSTLQSITNRGATTDNAIEITNATGSTGTSTGALVITGGVGIGQNLNVGGSINIKGHAVFSDYVSFNGTSTYVYSTNTYYTDNIIELHVHPDGIETEWEIGDGKDIGLRFHYYNRTNATGTNAALVLADDTQMLEWYQSGVELNGVFTSSAVYGAFKLGTIHLADTTVNLQNATSGALQVAGGVGVAKTQWIGGNGGVGATTATLQQSLIVNANGIGVNGDSYFSNNLGVGGNVAITGDQIVTGNLGIAGVSTFTGAVLANTTLQVTGNSTFVGTATVNSSLGVAGNFNVTGTSVLTGDVTATNAVHVGGNFNVTGTSVFSNVVQIKDQTDSAGTGSGALQVSGGVGIGGSVNIGGDIFVQGIINATVVGSISTATNLAGGVLGAIPYQTAFGRTSFINPDTAGKILTSQGAGAVPLYQNTLTLAGTTQASSTDSGAFQVKGGAGIGGNLYVGGNLNVDGDITFGGVGLNTISGSTATFDYLVLEGTGTVLTASGDARFVGGITATMLTVDGPAFVGALTATNATVTSLTVHGAANIETSVGIGSALSVGNGISVTGTAVITSTANIGGNVGIGGDVGIAGNLFTTGTNVTIGASYVDSNAGIKGNLFVTGTSVLVGSVYTDGNIGIKGNAFTTGTSVVIGNSYIDSSLGVKGNFNVTGTTTISGLLSGESAVLSGSLGVTGTTTLSGSVTIGPVSQHLSFQSPSTSTTATMSLDSFTATIYRSAKYFVQVVDSGITPNKVQVAELVVFHDNNSGSTIPYIIQYGIGHNTGELGSWNAVYDAGTVTLQFTPNYTPTNLTVKTVRTTITT